MVVAVLEGDGRDAVLFLKEIVGGAEVLPEVEVWGGGFFLQTLLDHAEGEDVDGDGGLVVERGLDDEVDFLDEWISHGEAADADDSAMHHDEAASALMMAVVGIGVADVDGEVVAAGGIELLLRDVVKAFRSLPVAFTRFGAEAAGEVGDGVGAEELPAFAA